MGQLEQCADVEMRKIQLGLGCVVAAQCRMPAHGQFGAFELSGHVVVQRAVGGVSGEFEAAQLFAAQGQPAEGRMALQTRIVEGSRAGKGDGELAGYIQILLMQPSDSGDVDASAVGLGLKTFGVEVVAAGAGNVSAFCAEADCGELHDLAGQCSLGAQAGDGFAVDAAAVEFERSRAPGSTEGTVQLELRIERAGYGQVLAEERLHVVHADLARLQVDVHDGAGIEGRPGNNGSIRSDEGSGKSNPGLAAQGEGVKDGDARGRVAAVGLE